MLPFYVKDHDFVEPDEPVYYVLAQDGLFLVRRNPLFSTELRVQGLPWLQPHGERARLHLPVKIPVAVLDQAIAFFQEVFRRHECEAILLLFYQPDGQRFELLAPPQQATPLTCRYEIPPPREGWWRVGTLHSHGSLEAAHSDVDARDEQYDDGIHFTVGNVDGFPSVSCELVVGGRRFPVNPGELLEGRGAEFPASWLSAVNGGTQD